VYEKFFGFQRAPFELVPDPDFLFLGETHDSALANLVLGIESGKGFVAISGPVGAGKTTVLRALLRRLGPGRKVCFLNQPEFAVADLLRSILGGFGEPTKSTDIVELRGRIRELLEERDTPGILIVDEAHLLTEDTLEQIRLLSNLENEKRKLLQIILSGQPELKDLLSSARLRPLTQRIEMFYEIRPLEPDETRAYIERRVRIAGNPAGLWFEEKALAEIHDRTGGIPRLINILAERCLITAYVAESHRIDRGIVHEAYRDLGSVTQSAMARRITEEEEDEGPPEPTPLRPVRRPSGGSPSSGPPVGTPRTSRSDSVRKPRRIVPVDEARRKIENRRAGDAKRRAAASPESSERWVAVAGILAISLLAVVSLGSRGVSGDEMAAVPAPAGVAEAAPPTTLEASDPGRAHERESETVEVWSGPRDSSAGVEEPADGNPPETRIPAAAPAERWAVHVASFRELDRARRFADTLRGDDGETVRISPTEVDTGLWYRVLLGEFGTRAEADERRLRLRETHELSFLRLVRLIHPEEREGS
jgi:type II secretory pathway predicted ATPase ExeA/cell division septation protein DedD